MGFFDIFKKKVPVISLEETEIMLKMRKMYKLFDEGKVEFPYAELITYQNEIFLRGHNQYFTNAQSRGGVEKEMSALDQILPAKLKENLHKAYEMYCTFKGAENDEMRQKILDLFDDVLYDNNEAITSILEEYADKLEL